MPKTILIVDDSASFRQVVSIILRSAGYEVVEAQDGKDGLAKLADKRAHLIISDINMPVMDGFEFLKAVKAMPDYKFTPVVMLTTESAQAKVQQGKANGAKAWMVKPFDPPQILAVVKQLVQP
jgi:two-component system, chemotaxis family, chemotaxis protein CheY